MPAPLTPPPDVLREAATHVASCYPEEGCGLILQGDDGWCFVPMQNAATRFHQADPESFPVDARGAYLFDPEEQRRRWHWAAEQGFRIAFIVHSHVDAPPEFSELDREMAMASPSEPLHPGVDYLVIEVREGMPGRARVYGWVKGAWEGRDIV